MPNPVASINFQDRVRIFDQQDVALNIWRECQPKLLVVTDSLSYTASSAFGLTQFVSTLASSPIHGLIPQVIKASRGGALAGADLPNFRFDDPSSGLLKSRYDVVFILGFNRENNNQLPQNEIDAIARFMQAGGGVFATGDHEDLGAAISRDIPRVRSMRFWKASDTPDAIDETRMSTNVSGPNEVEDFNDQSDRRPQNLYPNFRTRAGNPGLFGIPFIPIPGRAHPLLQLPPRNGVSPRVIEVFPDHPHEGQCHLPKALNTQFTLDGASVNEWPSGPWLGGPLAPEVVAMTMSHGSGFVPLGPKRALEPRAFIAICAYDGQRANVGRVATDATWHHFVNVNLDGSGGGPGQTGLQFPLPFPAGPLVDSDALARIRQYYRNLATWLMPRNVRRCLRFPLLVAELARYPLFEELVVPSPPPGDPEQLVRMGELVEASLASHLPAWQAEALVIDALDDAMGERAAQQLLEAGGKIGNLSMRELSLAALGAVTASTAETLAKLRDPKEIVPHKTFEPAATTAARTGVRKLIEAQHKELQRFAGVLAKLTDLEKV